MPAESAHNFALRSISLSRGRDGNRKPPGGLHHERYGTLRRFGLEFPNPIGLAAGFDKDGIAVHGLAALGFGFIEVGTVTNEAQAGNPKPRLFRLPRDHALINRLGFNNSGAAQVSRNLKSHPADCVLGVNIGKSRNVPLENSIEDYLASFEAIYDVADYIAVNVSSPNTPNLRELQQAALLEDLLRALQERNLRLAQGRPGKPLLLKIAPDLTGKEIESIVEVALRCKIAGIIATNTTVRRDDLKTPAARVAKFGQGGLSGAPLRNLSTCIISTIFRLTSGKLPIVGVGGVFTVRDAWEKIGAGASLIQLYTGFIYEGPAIARRLNKGLVDLLKREGLRSLDEAVGCQVK